MHMYMIVHMMLFLFLWKLIVSIYKNSYSPLYPILSQYVPMPNNSYFPQYSILSWYIPMPNNNVYFPNNSLKYRQKYYSPQNFKPKWHTYRLLWNLVGSSTGYYIANMPWQVGYKHSGSHLSSQSYCCKIHFAKESSNFSLNKVVFISLSTLHCSDWSFLFCNMPQQCQYCNKWYSSLVMHWRRSKCEGIVKLWQLSRFAERNIVSLRV